jgi:hypothetical protein
MNTPDSARPRFTVESGPDRTYAIYDAVTLEVGPDRIRFACLDIPGRYLFMTDADHAVSLLNRLSDTLPTSAPAGAEQCPQPRGCYLCRPDAPDASEEACSACDRAYWSNLVPVPVAFDSELCGTRFVTADRSLVCGRDDRWHLVHRDSAAGVRFVRVLFGAFITTAKHRTGVAS